MATTHKKAIWKPPVFKHFRSTDLLNAFVLNALATAVIATMTVVIDDELTLMSETYNWNMNNSVRRLIAFVLAFVRKYVHHKKGPGIFIEHHKFTHYLTPATPTTHGPIIVGRLLRNGQTKLIGVDVPYGYTLVIPGGCLHNDWYVVGKVATTIALDDQAKTAFVRGRDCKKIAMEFLRTFNK